MQLTDIMVVAFIIAALIIFSGEFLEFIIFGVIGFIVMFTVAAVTVVIKAAVGIYRFFTGK